VSFFRSRWVKAPEHVSELEPTSLPAGFRAAGVAAGIKRRGLDVGLLVSDEPATVSAARFTTNASLGAPVVVSKGAALDRLRAVLANSGNSNVADGERGLATARESQVAAAQALGLEPRCVGLASTGVIGRRLECAPLVAGIAAAAKSLGDDSDAFSTAILTTDRGPKRACLEVALRGGTVRLAAQAKGAGMISPAFATMFCFVETDAVIGAETLDLLTGVTVKRSFDRISVDGQLSTSDTVFCLASGASGVEVRPEAEDEIAFGEAMDALLRQLAIDIVADGEGARRVGRVVVRGSRGAVEPVARAVANSPLVKTALHGADPNYGRVLQAVGQALAGRGLGSSPDLYVDLDVEDRRLVERGAAVDLDGDALAAVRAAVAAPEVEYTITVPGAGSEAEVFFSDLSHDYVTLNAEYTT